MIKDGDLRFIAFRAHQSPHFSLLLRHALLRSLCSGGRRGCRGGEADAVALLRCPALLLLGALPCHAIRVIYLFKL